MLKFGNTFIKFDGDYLTGCQGIPSWVKLSDLTPDRRYISAGVPWHYNATGRYPYEMQYYGNPKEIPYTGKCLTFDTPIVSSIFPVQPLPECKNYNGLIETNNSYRKPPNYILSRITLHGHSVYGWGINEPAKPKNTTAYFEMNFPTNDKIRVNLLNGDWDSKYQIPTELDKVNLLKNPYQFFINGEEKQVDGLSSKVIQSYTTGDIGSISGCTIGQPFTVAMLRKVSDGSYSAYLCENSGTELSLFATGTNNVGYPLSAQGDITNYSGDVNLYHAEYLDTRIGADNKTHWGLQDFFVMNISQSACYNANELKLEDFNDMAIYQETR